MKNENTKHKYKMAHYQIFCSFNISVVVVNNDVSPPDVSNAEFSKITIKVLKQCIET